MTSNTGCRIELLGGLRVQIGERVITRFRTQKAASLLAYLAYYRHQSHPREVLIEMLWPECDPKISLRRLSTALWSLRGLLEPAGVTPGTVLTSNHFAVGLNPSVVTTDVANFLGACRKATRATDPAEQNLSLREAVECYSGELLPGFYEDWILTEQRRLAELFQKAQRTLHASEKQESVKEETSASLPQPPQSAQAEITTSLPPTFTRFFGRTELLEELHQLLSPTLSQPSGPRLVTITGTGGMGKTRLSLEVARGLVEDYSGSVWFVPLAEVSNSGLIGSALADALQLQRSGPQEPLEQSIAFLQKRKEIPSLLVLDNFEQLVEGGAEIVQTLLEQVPSLICLVTSRRLLGLTHEQEIILQPLPTPRGEVSPDHLTMFESVRLFIDRARTVRPTFLVTNQNAPDVADLCYRLEGIPLAIELAAARAQVLTPAQIGTQLQQRFAFLVSRKRDVVARHQTLHAAIEWSYRLLASELQRFFARLSVFRGGWTLEAAEAVCEEPKALEYLEQLREWSLVQVAESEQGMRFRMLETLREYAGDRLVEYRESETMRERHRDCFLALAEEAEPKLTGAEQMKWLQRLEEEHENLRAALDWSLTEAKIPEGFRMCDALQRFWWTRGHLSEGREWCERVLGKASAAERTKERTRILHGLGVLAWKQGDYTSSRTYHEESLSIRRELGDRGGIAGSLNNLGMVAYNQGDFASARAYHEESLEIKREIGDQSGIASSLCNLGNVTSDQGDYASARAYYEESLEISRQVEDWWMIAGLLNNLGMTALDQGDYTSALAYDEESLSIRRKLGDRSGVASALYNLGNVAFDQGNFASARAYYQESLDISRQIGERGCVADSLQAFASLAVNENKTKHAAVLWGAAEALREEIGLSLPPNKQKEYDSTLVAARQTLGEAAFDAAWEAGRAMTWEQAAAYALHEF